MSIIQGMKTRNKGKVRKRNPYSLICGLTSWHAESLKGNAQEIPVRRLERMASWGGGEEERSLRGKKQWRVDKRLTLPRASLQSRRLRIQEVLSVVVKGSERRVV